MLQALLISAAFDQNRDNPAMLDQLADAAKKGAKAAGVDLSLMTLTQNGFVPRSGADASEAIGSETDPKLAMATEATQKVDDSAPSDIPTYLGIAGVAVAGLGLAFIAGKSIGGGQ